MSQALQERPILTSPDAMSQPPDMGPQVLTDTLTSCEHPSKLRSVIALGVAALTMTAGLAVAIQGAGRANPNSVVVPSPRREDQTTVTLPTQPKPSADLTTVHTDLSTIPPVTYYGDR